MCVFFYENSRYSTHTLKKKARNIVQDTSSQLQLTGIEEIKQNKKTQTNREIKKLKTNKRAQRPPQPAPAAT
jgi:hypothetical protein